MSGELLASPGSLARENQVSRKWRGFVSGATITQGRKVYFFEESFTRTKKDWRNGDVHFIDQALAKILLNDIDAATNANIFACGGVLGACKRDGSTFRHEVKSRAPIHDKGWARVVGEHEYGDVIHGVIAPPTPPAFVWPRPANWPEHVPAEDPGPDVLKTSGGKVFIHTRCSAIVAEQVFLKRACGQGPAM